MQLYNLSNYIFNASRGHSNDILEESRQYNINTIKC